MNRKSFLSAVTLEKEESRELETIKPRNKLTVEKWRIGHANFS